MPRTNKKVGYRKKRSDEKKKRKEETSAQSQKENQTKTTSVESNPTSNRINSSSKVASHGMRMHSNSSTDQASEIAYLIYGIQPTIKR